ncbi:MAG: InlB B-repeat-containing protein [Kiritimatiellia bacterium]
MKIVQRVVSLTLAVFGLGMLGLAPSAQAETYNQLAAVEACSKTKELYFKGTQLGQIQSLTGNCFMKFGGISDNRAYCTKDDPLPSSAGYYRNSKFRILSNDGGVLKAEFHGYINYGSYGGIGYGFLLQLTQEGDDVYGQIMWQVGKTNMGDYLEEESWESYKSGTYNAPGTTETYATYCANLSAELIVLDGVKTVTFLGKDGAVLSAVEVDPGTAATAPEPPEIAGFRFIAWDKDFSRVFENLEVKAIYHQLFTVRFLDADGTELKTETVEEKLSATAPDMSGKMQDGYRFAGWDKEFDVVTEDLDVTATYGVAFSENPVWSSGLVQGKIDKANDFTTDILAESVIQLEVVPGTIMADCQAINKSTKLANPYTGTEFFWNDSNTTFGYFGYVYLAAGDKLNFCKNVDDSAYVKVGDSVLINNTTYTQYPVGTFTAETAGWYPVEVRVGDSNNSKGPAGGKIAPLGLGYNVNGKTTESATGWEAFVDPGDEGRFLKTVVPGAEPMLKIGRFAALENGDVTVELAAQNQSKDAALYALYGAADGGDDVSTWKHAVELAKVPPAGLETATYTIAGLSNHAAVRFAVATEGRGQKIWQCSDLITFTQKVPLVSLELGEPSDVAIAATIGYEALGEGATSATVKIEVADNPDFENSWFVDCGTMSVVGGTAEFSVADLTFATGYTVRVVVTSDTGATYVSEPQSFQTFNPYVAHEGDTLVWNGGENGTWDDTSANWLFGPNSVSWIDGCVAEIKTPATITLAAERRVIEIKAGADVTFMGADLVLADGAKVTYQKDATVRFENVVKGSAGCTVACRMKDDDIVYDSCLDAAELFFDSARDKETLKTGPTASAVWFKNVDLSRVNGLRGTMYAVQGSASQTLTFDNQKAVGGSWSTKAQVCHIINDGTTLTAQFQMGAYYNYSHCVKVELTQVGDDVEGRVLYWKHNANGVIGDDWDVYEQRTGDPATLADLKLIIEDILPETMVTEIAGDYQTAGELNIADGAFKVVGTGTLFGGDWTAAGSSCVSPVIVGDAASFEFHSSAMQTFANLINARNEGDGYSSIRKCATAGRVVVGAEAQNLTFNCSSEGLHRIYNQVDVYGKLTLKPGTYHLFNENGYGVHVYDGGSIDFGKGNGQYGVRDLRLTCHEGAEVRYNDVCAMGASDKSAIYDGATATFTKDYTADLSNDIAHGDITLKNGAKMTGVMMTWAWNRNSGKLTIDGASPSSVTLEKIRLGQKDIAAASGKKMIETLIVKDVTGDAAVDLTVSSSFYQHANATCEAGNEEFFGLVKQGAGTVLFTGTSPDFGASLAIEDGAVNFGPEAVLNGSKLFIKGTVAMDISAGAKVAFDAIDLPEGKTLALTGVLKKDSLKVGADKNALTAAQLAQITYEGKTGKVYVDENGCLRANTAMVLSIR